ncbi:MAG: type II secretion system F family protein [Rickettsiales bacterium]|jgi:type II secretory pathway component PulF|nr:type II secretion system F family protein [Rickettsiales bacterium]
MSLDLNLLYAKANFRFNTEKRLAMYRKLASLLRNNFTLMDALGRIERVESKGGTKPDEPFAIAMRAWQKNLERGQSFSDATRGWIPINETLMMTLGDVSKLHIAIENVVRVIEGTKKISGSMLNAVAYPLFLLALTFGIIVMVGLYLVPPLIEAAGTDVVWRGTAASLVWVADFSKNYWYVFAGAFVAAIFVVWISFANWSGRIRAKFDSLPPWSLYKIQVSVGWLMSLAAMVGAGGSLPGAIKMLADNSSPYLKSILDDTLKFIANGDNLGGALANTGRNFPNDEIIGDLAIYADMNGFDENLNKIANDYLDESVRKMEAISNILNSVGILLVSVIIGWVVFGTFDMQDQITAAIS